ncbi:MAG: serine/threonine-protein kinase [Polyangia bacterium]
MMVVRDAEAPGGERAKVLDFGLAKVKEPEVGGEGLTHTGTILGTPAYMAPEQCKSARAASDRSDMYSLGIILYEMLSSDIPFDAETDAELLSKHMFSEPPPLQQRAPHVAPPLCALVHRMLRKEPQDRPSAAEVVQELTNLLSGVGVAVSGPHKLGPPTSKPTSKPPGPGRTPPRTALGDEPTVVQPERGGDGRRPTPPAAPPVAAGPPPSAATPHVSPPPVSPTPAERPARRGVALVLSAVVLVGLGVAGGMVLQERQRQLVESARPKLVRWSIASLPADAEVVSADGKVLGRTPLSIEESRGVGARPLTLRLAGHADKSISLPLDHDAAVSEALTPLPQDAGAPPRDGGARDAAPAPDADDDAPRPGAPVIF